MNRADSARDRQEASGSTISREAAISVLPKTPTADATPSASPIDYPAVSGLDPGFRALNHVVPPLLVIQYGLLSVHILVVGCDLVDATVPHLGDEALESRAIALYGQGHSAMLCYLFVFHEPIVLV